MSDEQDKAGEKPGDGASVSETGKDGQPFDAARAQTTIDALRAEIKGLKGSTKELDAAKAKLKEIEDAGRSETEKLAARATEASEKLTAAEQRVQDLAIRLSVERTARKLNFIDEDDAFRLIDRKAVEIEDGEPQNVEALLKDLAKSKPHLIKSENGSGAATKQPPATGKAAGGGNGRADAEEATRKQMASSGRYSL